MHLLIVHSTEGREGLLHQAMGCLLSYLEVSRRISHHACTCAAGTASGSDTSTPWLHVRQH